MKGGTLTVIEPDRTVTKVAWNGKVEDYEAAEALFKDRLSTGGYLAFKKNGTKKYEQTDVLDRAADTKLTPALVGG